MATPPLALAPRLRIEVLGRAFELFGQQAGTWVLATLLVLVIQLGLGLTLGLLLGLCLPVIGNALAQIPAQLLFVGLLRMALKQLRGGRIEVGDAFAVGDVLGPAAVATILTTLGVSVGMVFCILPGLVLSGLWLFTFPLVADRGLEATAAMGQSWEALKTQWPMATAFVLVLMLLAMAGAALCCVGGLVTMPVAVLSLALAYREHFPEQAGPALGGPA